MFPDKTICRFMFSGLALVWVLSATAARVSADEAQMSASPPQPDQAAPPAPASGSAASLPAPAPGSASSIQPAVVPCGSVTEVSAGPLLEARKVLFNRLNLARKEGIGVGAYMAEFARIEEAVRNGDAPERLQPRIASLARSLKEQLDRR